jgi:hypothetical protein
MDGFRLQFLMRAVYFIKQHVFLLSALSTSFIFALVTPPLQASDPTYYSFYPGSPMSLGVGISPQDLRQAKQKCITSEEYPLDSGALSTNFHLYAVSSNYELKEAFKLDLRLDASYLTAKAGGSYHIDSGSHVNQSDLLIVVTAESEFPRRGLRPPVKLTQEAQDLLTAGNVTEFDGICGSQLVIQERRGARVSAVLTISDISRESRAKITSSAHAGGSFGPVSASASLDIDKELKAASAQHRVTVDIRATGGEGFGKLGQILQTLSGKGVGAIEGALGTFMTTFTAENPAPIGYFIGPMPGRNAAFTDLWTDLKLAKLYSLVDDYRSAQRDVNEVTGVLHHDDPRAEVFDSMQLKQLEQSKARLQTFMETVADAHEKCLKSAGRHAQECDINVTRPTLPSFFKPIPEDPAVGLRVVADGVLLNRTMSAAAIGGNPSEALLKRVQHVKPGVKAASIVFTVEDGYLLDTSLMVGPILPGGEQTARVFYSGSTQGNKLIQQADAPFAIFFSAIQDVQGQPKADLTLDECSKYVAAYASDIFHKYGSTDSEKSGGYFYLWWRVRDYFHTWPFTWIVPYRVQWSTTGNTAQIVLTPEHNPLPAYKGTAPFESLSFTEYLAKYPARSGPVLPLKPLAQEFKQ